MFFFKKSTRFVSIIIKISLKKKIKLKIAAQKSLEIRKLTANQEIKSEY